MTNQPDPIHGGISLPRTTQRKLIDESWERARAANKRLIVRPTGGWSEQCLMFNDSLAKSGAALKKLTDRAEYLVVEHMYFDRSHALDWLPEDLYHFQSVYLADPTVGRSSFTIVTNVTDAALLGQYLELWYGTDNLPAVLRQLVLDHDPAKTSIPFSHLITAAAHATGYTDDLATVKQFLRDLRALKEKHESLFEGIDINALELRTVVFHLHSGRTHLDQLEETNPEWVKGIKSDHELVAEVMFYVEVSIATRQRGYKAAAELAAKQIETIRPLMPQTPLSYFGTMVDVSGIETRFRILQKVLEASAGTLTLADAETWVAEVMKKDLQFFFVMQMQEIFYALGAYNRAADLVEYTIPKWTGFYESVIKTMQQGLEGCIAAGQTAQAEKLKALLPYIKQIPENAVAENRKRAEHFRRLAG